MGGTPATITDVIVDAKLLENGELFPKPFPYRHIEREAVSSAFFVTREKFFHTRTFPLRGQDYIDAKSGAKKLWVFGHVDYIDAFGQRYRGGYVRVYDHILDDGKKNNLVFMTEGRYDYDRPREQDEGNDWNEKIQS